ncbi:conserved exported hypothetical protein [Hyphomicrobiales bacterium]|nr:conserved exported hypothetical protein [Hyphomicrobiales bacterium]CAH1684466.1 conserved exported hypothetical protein [Hyphomicrobiales bacterium]
MITAGMAATRPMAVASNASAMPGATTARFVVFDFAMPMNEFMMPQTVPNRPTKGAVAPMVARSPVPRVISRPARASMRDKAADARSLMPSAGRSAETSSSCLAARTRAATTPLSSRPCMRLLSASSRLRASTSPVSERRARRLAAASSMLLASQTVQVISEAKARPTITALTTRSACMNMPQGDRSCGNPPAEGPCSEGSSGSAVSAVGAVAGPAAGVTTPVAVWDTGGRASMPPWSLGTKEGCGEEGWTGPGAAAGGIVTGFCPIRDGLTTGCPAGSWPDADPGWPPCAGSACCAASGLKHAAASQMVAPHATRNGSRFKRDAIVCEDIMAIGFITPAAIGRRE